MRAAATSFSCCYFECFCCASLGASGGDLNLDVSALSKLVGLFDVNGDNRVDFNEFCKKVLPDDYARTATKTEMIGIPAMTHNRQRRVVKPTTPFTTGLAGPSSTATILGLTFKSPSQTRMSHCAC